MGGTCARGEHRSRGGKRNGETAEFTNSHSCVPNERGGWVEGWSVVGRRNFDLCRFRRFDELRPFNHLGTSWA